MHSHLLSDKASLSKIRKLIRLDLVQVGARPSVIFDCLVAVTEACGQALQGRPDQSGEPSRITWSIDRNTAEFCIEDHSEPDVPPEGQPGRRIHEVLERETGLKGLGEDVIQNLMDHVEVVERDPGRTTTMVKNLR